MSLRVENVFESFWQTQRERKNIFVSDVFVKVFVSPDDLESEWRFSILKGHISIPELSEDPHLLAIAWCPAEVVLEELLQLVGREMQGL